MFKKIKLHIGTIVHLVDIRISEIIDLKNRYINNKTKI